MRQSRPRDATIAITYRCNARCVMCHIWQKKNPPVMPVEYFKHLSADLRHINLSGGEPFLHPDLPAIVKIVKDKCPQASIDISTNGLATELIIATMGKLLKINPKIGARVSLDGLKDVHEKIRGVPGIFHQAMATIDGLRRLGVNNLGFGFTVQDENAGDLAAVYELARKKNLQLSLTLAQNSEIYFAKTDNRPLAVKKIGSALDQVIKKQLASWRPKNLLRAYFNYGLKYNFLTNWRLLPSGAGYDSMFIDPSGDIYPSMLINLPIGNLGEAGLDEIWHSPEATRVREKMRRENISEAWIICTVREQIRQHRLQALWWIFKNKFFGYEGAANQ